ncbi:MAG: hypothetical protein ACRC6T_14505 [Sarcina sp.]
MNKKLFIKLGLGGLIAVSSLSFIACGESDATAEINSPTNTATSQAEDSTKISVDESEKAVVSSENTESKEQETQEDTKPKTENIEEKAESKTENIKSKVEVKTDEVEENIKPEVEKESEKIENTTENAEQKEKEEHYYTLINNAMQKQIDYINSIEDPREKQSVQSSMSAAIGEATLLEINHPEDSEIIQTSLQKVLK